MSELYFYTAWSHNQNEDHTFQDSSWWAGEVLQDREKRHINLLISYRSRKFLIQQLFFISPYFPVSGPSFSLFSLPFYLWERRKYTVVHKNALKTSLTAVSVSNSQKSVTQKNNLPVLNTGTPKTFESCQDFQSHFFTFLYLKNKSTA